MTKIDCYIFSAFTEEGRVAPQENALPATGQQSFSQERYYKSQGDLVASNEKTLDANSTQYIFWTKENHVTTDVRGFPINFDASLGEEQFLNPIQEIPVVNVARDRDAEPWALQGEDMIDLTLAIQKGWTDVMTIAKHQGFSILTITSEEEPKKLQIGVNRAVWLKTNPQGPQPSIGYVQGNSPLEAYKLLLQELLALLLTTNNMEPGSIGGSGTTKQFTSGFHALISMADSLEAIESDKPMMAKAEKDLWVVLSKWHNWLFDNNLLKPEARALGKFSEDMQVHILYADVKPLESEDERIARVKGLLDLGLITKLDAIKKLNPDMSQDQALAKLVEIQEEKQANVEKMQSLMGGSDAAEEGLQPEDDSEEHQSGDEGGQAEEASDSNSVIDS
jgi:hypothetical protein